MITLNAQTKQLITWLQVFLIHAARFFLASGVMFSLSKELSPSLIVDIARFLLGYWWLTGLFTDLKRVI